MAISQRLHTKLVQKLILTPSLQQAIKLLPMSTLELSELLNQEMVENPMLEETPSETLEQQEPAQEKPEEKKDEKKPEKDTQASLLDNLVERSKDFAEDVEPLEEEGDPNGLKEGTATEARAGDIYRGQLVLFFRRNFSVPNLVQDPDKKKAIVAVVVASDGALKSAELMRSSGDPLFDQSAVDAAQALIQAGATLPEPPADVRDQFYGATLPVEYTGRGLR